MPIRPLLLVAALTVLSRPSAAQPPDAARTTATAPVSGAVVSGVTYDSLAHAPLAGAMVQLVSADDPTRFSRSTTSDPLGRFTVADIPDGRYTLGFVHPMLDSLGMDSPTRALSVSGSAPVRIDLAIPSPARLRAAVCGPRPEPDEGAVIVGVVRAAEDGAPVAGVTVLAQWVEFSFSLQGLARHTPRLVSTTAENGWFALCGVPRGTTTLLASRSADSTDLIDVQVPAGGFARQGLFLGHASTAVAAEAASGGGVSGIVVTAVGGKPLAGAQVRIAGGRESASNDRGQWTVPNAASGTRMLEVRAVGYYPDRRPVDVVAGAAPIRISLATLKSVLDTVKVTATAHGRERTGFDDRRRSGTGRYLTAADLTRRSAVSTSKLFRTMGGLRLGFAYDTLVTDMNPNIPADAINTNDPRILMRGSGQRWCAPAIYIDGIYIPQMSTDDIDAAVDPEKIAGIEVYTRATVPAQFGQMTSSCGSILIWRK
jgi:hypothetical protein